MGENATETSFQTNEVQALRWFNKDLLLCVRESGDSCQTQAKGQGVCDLRGFEQRTLVLLHESIGLGKGRGTAQVRQALGDRCLLRDAKQNLGLEDYELRKLRGVRRHLTMVFVAHALLELGLKRDATLGKLAACLETIGAKCRRACAEVLQSFIQSS